MGERVVMVWTNNELVYETWTNEMGRWVGIVSVCVSTRSQAYHVDRGLPSPTSHQQ